MPARKTWLLRLTQIREELASLDVPVIDRAVFERIFGVRRRRAVQLMHFFAGFQTSQALLVDRLELLRQLEPLEAGTEYVLERGRRERLTESLEKLRRHHQATAVALPVPPDVAGRKVGELPQGICLEAGSLRVNFVRAEDLLAALYELAQTAANDFDSFRRTVEGG